MRGKVFKLAAAVRRVPRSSAIGPLKVSRQCSNLPAWLCTNGVPELMCLIVLYKYMKYVLKYFYYGIKLFRIYAEIIIYMISYLPYMDDTLTYMAGKLTYMMKAFPYT